jgi:alkylation response protein AidB-like acyl-CoA dehydrogenase
LAATALKHGSDDLKGRYLPGLIAGDSVFAVAIDETAKHRPSRITTRAEKSGNGFRLTGAKSFVIQGASSDMIVVAARTSGSDEDADGITLFAVPRDASGMSHDVVRLVDSSMATHTRFDGVELDGDAVIGEIDGGRAVLDAMLLAGIAADLPGVGIIAAGNTTVRPTAEQAEPETVEDVRAKTVPLAALHDVFARYPALILPAHKAIPPKTIEGLDIDALNEQAVANGWEGEPFTNTEAAAAYLSANFKG